MYRSRTCSLPGTSSSSTPPPYLGEADLAGWHQALDRIKAMQAGRIIPGHGPLSTKKDLTDLQTYLKIFDRKAKALCATESDPEKVAAALLKTLPPRTGGPFIVSMNLKMRYLKTPAK